MTIYALWNGGPGYRPSDFPEDLETFTSIAAAKDALVSRERSGHWQPQAFTAPDGHTRLDLTPCVEDSSMDLYFADPRESTDPYPDRRLSIGPRGGVREERT